MMIIKTLLPREILGLTDTQRNIIYVDKRQSLMSERCTIMHELVHLELGHYRSESNPHVNAKFENQARRITAERLVSYHDLCAAAREHNNIYDICELLNVDIDVLTTYLEHLDSEQKQILREI